MSHKDPTSTATDTTITITATREDSASSALSTAFSPTLASGDVNAAPTMMAQAAAAAGSSTNASSYWEGLWADFSFFKGVLSREAHRKVVQYVVLYNEKEDSFCMTTKGNVMHNRAIRVPLHKHHQCIDLCPNQEHQKKNNCTKIHVVDLNLVVPLHIPDLLTEEELFVGENSGRSLRIKVADCDLTAGLLFSCALIRRGIVKACHPHLCTYGMWGNCNNGVRCLHVHCAKSKMPAVDEMTPLMEASTSLGTLLTRWMSSAPALKEFLEALRELGINTVGDVQALSNTLFEALGHRLQRSVSNGTNGNGRERSVSVASSPQPTQQASTSPESLAFAISSRSATTTLQHLELPPTSATVSAASTPTTSPQKKEPTAISGSSPQHRQQVAKHFDEYWTLLLRFREFEPSLPLAFALQMFPSVTVSQLDDLLDHTPHIATVGKLLEMKSRNFYALPWPAAVMDAAEKIRLRLEEVPHQAYQTISIAKAGPSSFLAKVVNDILAFPQTHTHKSWRKQDSKRPNVTSAVTYVDSERCHCIKARLSGSMGMAQGGGGTSSGSNTPKSSYRSRSAEQSVPLSVEDFPPNNAWCQCPRQWQMAVNYELSTPSGSRCSEQNCLGKIASMGVPTDACREIFVHGSSHNGVDTNPLFPCGVCENMLRRISKDVQKVNKGGGVMLYMFDQEANPKKLVCLPVNEISHRDGLSFKKFVEEDLKDD